MRGVHNRQYSRPDAALFPSSDLQLMCRLQGADQGAGGMDTLEVQTEKEGWRNREGGMEEFWMDSIRYLQSWLVLSFRPFQPPEKKMKHFSHSSTTCKHHTHHRFFCPKNALIARKTPAVAAAAVVVGLAVVGPVVGDVSPLLSRSFSLLTCLSHSRDHSLLLLHLLLHRSKACDLLLRRHS